jgi:broad specificity phosphatase PhoE/plasmid maintenance system antidote protein VapI
MITDFKQSLGARITKIRKNLGFSQEEVANYLDIHRPSFTQIEKGDRDLSAEELSKLCKLFNLPVEELLNTSTLETEDKVANKDLIITFFRHGEAIDDVYNQYGGWGDVELSPKGIAKSYQVAQELKQSNKKFDIIYTSPLLRAKQKAEILGRELHTDVKVLQYIKERNTYGLLCGLNKQVAEDRYPELVEQYNGGEFVLGSEREEDFKQRIPLIFSYIKNSGFQNVCCVTHGKVMSEVIVQALNMRSDKQEDNCKLVMGIENERIYYIESEGISFKK